MSTLIDTYTPNLSAQDRDKIFRLGRARGSFQNAPIFDEDMDELFKAVRNARIMEEVSDILLATVTEPEYWRVLEWFEDGLRASVAPSQIDSVPDICDELIALHKRKEADL